MGRVDPRHRDVLRLAFAVLVGLTPAIATAEQPAAAAVILPTVTPATESARVGELRPLLAKDGPLRDRAREVDAVLADAAQDLGLSLNVDTPAPDGPRVLRDGDIVEQARTRKAWIVSPRIERDGGELIVRIIAVPPGSKVALVREERVTPETLALRVVVMLRDLVSSRGSDAANASDAPKKPREDHETKSFARSPGRAVLAVSTAAFGGFVGYSLQKTSRSDDPRLLYPLMALGTGVGLGASMIVADEWDVGLGDAWYLAAGTWWPTTSALLLTAGYDVQPTTDRYAYGVLAGVGGTGLAALALSRKGLGEGPAMMTHSGGALGTFVGGMTELIARGTTDYTPYRGLGYGAGAGWLIAAAAATQVEVSPSRVLLVDLGAGLGALGGAAAGSPLLFKDPTESRQRAWLGVTLGGSAVGIAAALWATRAPEPAAPPHPALAFVPLPGVIAMSQLGARVAPAFGGTWSGSW